MTNNTISSISIVTDNIPAESKNSTAPIEPSFGWNTYAELVNGRFAMMGFVVLLGLEFFTGQDLWTWLGLR
jgi:Chlorophyll A-B binding protein